jgi:ribosomal protein S18 acetylase RimI-like enzyme
VSIRLRPMRPDEFDAWADRSRRQYADDVARNGGLPRDLAEQKAERDFAVTLPLGLQTPEQVIRVVDDDELGPVGIVWYAERRLDLRTVTFLYELSIDEEHRGRGLGRRAMELFEDEVRRNGGRELELNVFGGNTVARNLYRSMGYSESSVHMTKTLG